MKLAKILGVALVLIGLVAVAAVVAPRALGQSRAIVRVPDSPAIAQVFAGGGGYIGISIRNVEKADVDREKLAGQFGAVVEEVRSGSPAEKAGLKSGDVVTEFDGERVRSAQQLTRLVRETPEGRAVKASVMRAGKRVDVEITPSTAAGGTYVGSEVGRDLERLSRDLTLRVQPELDRLREFHLEPFTFEFGGRIQAARLGIGAQDLTPQLAEYFGVKEGVLVTSVSEASVASKAGLKAGDVITAIDGAAVNRVSDVRRRVERLDDGEDFTIAISRDRKSQTLNAKMVAAERPTLRRRLLSSL